MSPDSASRRASGSDRIGLRHLRYFMAVVEHGSIVRAAEALFVAASGVSQTVGDLERHLGTRLLDRSRSGSVPTAAGLRLVERARAAVAAFEEAVDTEFDAARAAPHLRVLSTPSLIQEPTSTLIGSLHRRVPDVRITLTEPTGSYVADALTPVLSGEVDVAVTEHPEDAPRGTRVVRMPDLEVMLVCPPGTPAPADGRFTVRDLKQIGLVVSLMFESSDVHHRLQAVDPDVHEAVAMRTEHRDAFMRLTRAGAGAVLLERRRAMRAERLGCVIGDLEGLVPRRISAVALQRRSTPVLEEFLRLCALPRDEAPPEKS